MKKFFSTVIVILFSFHLYAQQIRPATSAQIYNKIAELKNLTNVLYVAAHPDDENTRLLAWLANDQHIRTAYLALTRGDGGQNILGSEQGAALGLIRTHELLEARKLDGAEQFFTRAIDFGFSKNPQETFKHWNEYLLTNDVVRIIRKFRPDVIICRFPPDSRAGHGQHSVSAIVAAKAFKLSGSKLQYTEHFKYYPAWQAKRLLWNTYQFGNINTTSEDQYHVTIGNYNPNIAMGYGELAGISRSLHRTQGAGTPQVPGENKEYFALVDGDSLQHSLFDGIDITWNRVHRPEIGNAIDDILKHFNFNKPAASLTALLELRKDIVTVKNNYWRTEKLKELDQIIIDAMGFMAEATTDLPQATAGTNVPFTLRFIVRTKRPVKILVSSKNIEEQNLQITAPEYDSLYAVNRVYSIKKDQPITQPYWLMNPGIGSIFSVPDDSLIGLPETPNTLTVPIKIEIGDAQIPVNIPLSYKKLDPIKGDVVEQLRIVPDVTIKPFANLIITNKDGSVSSSVMLHAYNSIKNATLYFYGNNREILQIRNINLAANSDTTLPFSISAAQSNKANKDEYILTMELVAEGNKYDKTLHLIQYDHIPTLQYFTPAAAKVIHNNWKVTVKKIGFVEGAGDYTVTFLRLAGLNVDILKDADFINVDQLKKYDVIITGIRSVNVQKKMSYWMPVLLQYVKNGGTLLMQYNNPVDLATTKIGPYPLTLSTLRVTEEDAKIDFIQPKNRLLNYPNKITDKDFDNWVQERGLYFVKDWDKKYQPIFQIHDTNEQPLDGATLYTTYGKGHYIYTSLSFFRQLPAGNKGAIRLLMNMLSVGK